MKSRVGGAESDFVCYLSMQIRKAARVKTVSGSNLRPS